MEALSGHDDDVISLAIGAFLIESASMHHERVVERHLPWDLRDHSEENNAPGLQWT